MRTAPMLVSVAALLVLSAGTVPGAAGQPLGPVVETSLGTLAGERVAGHEDVLVFRGIPYAEPPVGDARWRPPIAKGAWDGTRAAATFGPACWQGLTPETSIYTRGDLERDEDCLYLNVWTAAADAAEARPVMVWFHGGGHSGGWGSAKVFDGTALAQKGVVLVTINYRLGAFGFLAHPALSAESAHDSSGNYGLLDKVAALEWVRDSVGAFGGDPGNVTIFGQSAGSWSVCYLMASPLAAGLFHKAIGHSGGCFRGGRPDAGIHFAQCIEVFAQPCRRKRWGAGDGKDDRSAHASFLFCWKNPASSWPHSAASTPLVTEMRQLNAAESSNAEAPALGSAAPNTRRSTRACTMAPTHIVQGSIVTYSVAPGRR